MEPKVSKWEIAGVPATLLFGAAYRLGLFEKLGLTAEDMPDLMLVIFAGFLMLRLVGQWVIAQRAKEQKAQ